MRKQNYTISNQCEQIIVNGARIDDGRYYTTSNADFFTNQLTSVITGLYSLLQEIVKLINLLEESRNKAKRERAAAINSLKTIPKPPCGYCEECSPQSYTSSPSGNNNGNNNNRSSGGRRRGGPQMIALK